jgi:tRNA 2-thiouridine synthesizing protein A
MIEVDVRGFVCPIPVLRTQETIKKNSEEDLVVIVDNAGAKENVIRLAKSKGYSIEVKEVEGDYQVKLTPPEK